MPFERLVRSSARGRVVQRMACGGCTTTALTTPEVSLAAPDDALGPEASVDGDAAVRAPCCGPPEAATLTERRVVAGCTHTGVALDRRA